MKYTAKPKGYRTPKTNKTEDDIIKLIDELTQYEDYRTAILPALQNDVKAGLTPKQLQEKYASIVTARVITEAVLGTNGAMTAAKDILDRAHGKAVEKREIKHTLAELSDKELDAMLESEVDDLTDMEERFDS